MSRLKIISFLLFFLAVSPLQAADEPKHILLGTTEDYPPFTWLEGDKKLGFVFDLNDAVARAAGFTYDLRIYEWDEAKNRLRNGMVDALDSMFYSPERDRIFDFSEPHSVVTHSLLVWKENTTIFGVNDLRGKSVIVLRGDIMHEYLLNEKIGAHPVLVPGASDLVKHLSAHRGEAALVSRPAALYFIKKFKIRNIKEVGKPLEPLEMCYSVREGNKELIELFNKGLSAVKKSGEYDRLQKKWFEPLEPGPSLRESAYWIVAGIVFFACVIGLLWIWNWVLSNEVRNKTEAVRIANDQLKKTAEAKTDTVRMVAHEVRAPLGIMQGYLDMLKETPECTDKQRGITDKIQNAIDRMNRLVQDLMDMSRIEEGRLKLSPQLVLASSLAQSMQGFFQNPFETKSIRFEARVEPREISFEADRDRIEQCLINLIGNAIRYTPDGGQILLRILDAGENVRFEVHDSGEGIAGAELGRLFQRNIPVDSKSGYGLGLAISKGLIELHQGKIWADSRKGEGSTFLFTIPKRFNGPQAGNIS